MDERRFPGDPRPVYVAERPGRVLCHDHGALRVTTPGQADRWVPLRHVSRLVVPEACPLDWPLVVACARRGIPVVVQDQDGGALLRVVGTGWMDTGLRRRLMDLTADIDWAEKLLTWRDANRSRIDAILRRRLKAPARCHTHAGLLQWVAARAEMLAGPAEAHRSQRHLYTFCLARMQETLMAHGIDASGESWLVDDVDLCTVLSDLLAWQLQPLRLGLLKARAHAARAEHRLSPLRYRDLVRRFERHHSRVDRTTRDLLNRLNRWLVELA